VNTFSMNLGKRFWAVDNSDINRMFPGYDKGETTQRIAAGLFSSLEGYEHGIQFASFWMPGNFVPHIRIMDAGYHDEDCADSFGLPYVMVSRPTPLDTATLNYNWQVFNTQAYSLYTRETKNVHEESAMQAVNAVLSFMRSNGLLKGKAGEGTSIHFREQELVNVLSTTGGIYFNRVAVGAHVQLGAVIAEILDPYTGEIDEEVRAPYPGIVFFNYNSNLVNGHEVICRLLPDEPLRKR
jgi:predicted deacylase